MTMLANDRIEILAERSFRANGVNLYLWGRDYKNDRIIARPVELETVDEEEMAGRRFDPLISISMGAAQGLMDELWRIGVRPTEQVDSVAVIGAVKYHLEDMRRLVFEKG